jgi:hypothetical protein
MQAAKRSKPIVVSHALILVAVRDAVASERIVLEHLGETIVPDLTLPDWTSPSR